MICTIVNFSIYWNTLLEFPEQLKGHILVIDMFRLNVLTINIKVYEKFMFIHKFKFINCLFTSIFFFFFGYNKPAKVQVCLK